MQLYLVNRRYDGSTFQQGAQCLLRKVTHTNSPALIPDHLLHLLPSLDKRRRLINTKWLPLGRYSPWPVHEKHIDVVQVNLPKGDFQRSSDIMMEISPELSHDSDLGPGNAAAANRAADDRFNSIVLRGVNETVPTANRVNYGTFKSCFIGCAEPACRDGGV